MIVELLPMKIIKSWLKANWPFLIVFVFFTWLFASLLSSHMLEVKSGDLYSGGSTWGDLPFHLSLISNFVDRGMMATISQHPLFDGINLTYPFLPDLLSAFLVKIGLSLRVALILPSFILILAVVSSIYLLTRSITGKRLGAFFAPFLFFFNGSVFGLYYYWKESISNGYNFWSGVRHLSKSYAHLEEHNLRFSNIIADYILPQRAIILGLFMGLATIFFFWKYWQKKNKKTLAVAGIIVAFLPLVHTHTFLTMIMVGGFLFLIEIILELKKWKKTATDWIYFILPVLLIGLPQFLLIAPENKGWFIRWKFSWMKKADENFMWFWIKNLGLYIPFVASGYWVSSKKIKTFYLSFFLVFALTNLFIFQPNDYDNMKFMIYWFLLSVILMAIFIDFLYSKFGWKSGALITLILIPTMAVGGLSVLRESYSSWRLFDQEDLALAEFVKKQTSPNSLFLTSDRHNHPIPGIAGRRIVVGYRGWLWTHGIDYKNKEKDILEIYEGGHKSLSLIRQYQINYILFENAQKESFHMNRDFLDNNFPLIFETANFRLYQT